MHECMRARGHCLATISHKYATDTMSNYNINMDEDYYDPLLNEVQFQAWMETQGQTNGDAITVGGQKPMFDKSINRDQITQYTNDVNSNDNNQS